MSEAKFIERPSGAPFQIPTGSPSNSSGPLIAPFSPVPAKPDDPVAIVNVTSCEGEIEHGTIEIPLEVFREITNVGVCTVSWGDETVTLNFGHSDGLSIHIAPKGG